VGVRAHLDTPVPEIDVVRIPGPPTGSPPLLTPVGLTCCRTLWQQLPILWHLLNLS